MAGARVCDLCGRPGGDGPNWLALDADHLWICGDCRGRLTLPPVGEAAGDEMPAEVAALVGQSAGAICYTLNLPYRPPYRAVIEAASRIAYDEDRVMSAWSFVGFWLDGTTTWRSPDGDRTALVPPDGPVRVERQ